MSAPAGRSPCKFLRLPVDVAYGNPALSIIYVQTFHKELYLGDGANLMLVRIRNVHFVSRKITADIRDAHVEGKAVSERSHLQGLPTILELAD